MWKKLIVIGCSFFIGLQLVLSMSVPVHASEVRQNASETTTTNYVAIFIEFSDLPTTSLDSKETLEQAELLMNDDGSSDKKITTALGQVPIMSLHHYVNKYSYGKEEVKTKFFPQDEAGVTVSYVAPHPRTYYMRNTADGYGNDSSELNRRRKELLEGALASAKESIERTYASSDLDVNNDGQVDAITFFVEGSSYLSDQRDIVWQDLLWSHKGELYFSTKLCGKSVQDYNLINTYNPTGVGGVFSLNRSSYGTILHEYMHIRGLPDLYRGYASTTYPVGYYDLMGQVTQAAPQGMLAYHFSDALGWHVPLEQVTSSKTITLHKPKYKDESEKNAVKIISLANSKEYFIAEYYNASAYSKSAGVSDKDGIVLYRVNTNVYNGNIQGTPGGTEDQIYIFRPEETGVNQGDGKLANAVLNVATGRTTFGKTLGGASGSWDSESLYYSDGENSGIVVKVVSQDEETITIEVTVPQVQGSGTKEDPFLLYDLSDFSVVKGNGDSSSAYFKLMDDIDGQGQTFESIYALKGEFDGNGHTIRNLKITGGGLFEGLKYGSIVKNLNLEDIEVTYSGVGYVGGLAGSGFGTIQNVHIKSGTVKGSKARNSGGIVGTLGDSGSIINSSSSVTVASTAGGNGGLVGLYQGGKIKDCFVNGKVETGTSLSGAIIAQEYVAPKEGMISTTYFDRTKTGLSAANGSAQREGMYGVELKDIAVMLPEENSIQLYDLLSSDGELTATFTIQDTTIGTIDKGTWNLLLRKSGSTKLYADISVGSSYMRLTSNVKVEEKPVEIPEEKPVEIPEVYDFTVKSQSGTIFYYSGGYIQPKVIVTGNNKGVLREGTDYRVQYFNNRNVGQGKITIIGINKYEGVTKNLLFSIKPSKMQGISVGNFTGVYDKKAHTIRISGVPAQSTIWYRTSATGAWTRTKPTRTSAGTTTVYYMIKNPNYITVTGRANIVIAKKSVVKLSISSIGNQSYTGRQIKPKITVKDGTTILKSGVHYTISYGTNRNTGKGYVKITGKGNYAGSIIRYFNIVPKAPSVKVAVSKGSLKVTSKSTGASGYQIAYSTNSKSGFKYVTAGSSKKISKLKRNTYYYVKVRAYKTIDGKKVYGAYSTVKRYKCR